MDLEQFHLLRYLFLYFAPVFFACFATALAWRSISHRVLFGAVSVVCFLGLTSILFPVVLHHFPFKPTPVFNALTATAVLVALLGFPLLFWLYKVLRHRA